MQKRGKIVQMVLIFIFFYRSRKVCVWGGEGCTVVRPYELNQGIVVRFPADTKRLISKAHRLAVRLR
jgi:hypothetical protein